MTNLKSIAGVVLAGSITLTSGAFAQEEAVPVPGNLVESYQSWRVECNNVSVPKPAARKEGEETKQEGDEAAKNPETEVRQLCDAFQVYNNNKSGNEIVRFIFSYTGEKGKDRKLIAGIRTLVDISFQSKPQVAVDGKELVSGEFVRCSGTYCYTRFDISDKQVAQLQEARDATFQYPLASGRVIRIRMSSAGLSDALASLKAKEAK